MSEQPEDLKANTGRAWIFPLDAKIDALMADGTHRYWSTHCRHDRHDACSETEITDRDTVGPWESTIERKPAQCKTCASPCICPCHAPVGSSGVSDGR